MVLRRESPFPNGSYSSEVTDPSWKMDSGISNGFSSSPGKYRNRIGGVLNSVGEARRSLRDPDDIDPDAALTCHDDFSIMGDSMGECEEVEGVRVRGYKLPTEAVLLRRCAVSRMLWNA